MKHVAEPQGATDDRMCGAKNTNLHAVFTLFTKQKLEHYLKHQ